MREPYFSLYRGEQCLSDGWKDLILCAEITDEAGGEGDKLMIELDDKDGQIVLPETGVILHARGGYVDEAGAKEGDFEIDQIDAEGWPQKVILHGTSAGSKKGVKERKTKAYQPPDYKTYGDIFDELGQNNKWKIRITDELRNTPLVYEAQQEESDSAFGTRLGEARDHLVSVKNENLVAAKRGEGTSVSGKELEPLVVAPGINLMKYRCSWKDKAKHGKVEATYFDRKKAKTETVEEDAGGDDSDTAYRFREPFSSKEEAERAVQARKRELERGEGSATFDIEGDVTASSQRPVEAQDIRDKVNGRWNTKRCTHRWGGQGYTCSLECEPPNKKKEGKKAKSGNTGKTDNSDTPSGENDAPAETSEE